MSKHLEKLANATFDEVMADPKSFGMPTFDEFAKNPETLLGRDDERLQEVDRGSTQLNRVVRRQIYEI